MAKSTWQVLYRCEHSTWKGKVEGKFLGASMVIKQKTDEDSIAGNALILQVSGRWPVHYMLSSPFHYYS